MRYQGEDTLWASRILKADTADIRAIGYDEFKQMPEIIQATHEYLGRPNVASDLEKVENELTDTWRARRSLQIASIVRKLGAKLQSIQEISSQSLAESEADQHKTSPSFVALLHQSSIKVSL